MNTFLDILEDLSKTFMENEVGEIEIMWFSDHIVVYFDGLLSFTEYYTWVDNKWVCSTDWDLNDWDVNRSEEES